MDKYRILTHLPDFNLSAKRCFYVTNCQSKNATLKYRSTWIERAKTTFKQPECYLFVMKRYALRCKTHTFRLHKSHL